MTYLLLRTALSELADRLMEIDCKLILGGGYGLFEKQLKVTGWELRTLVNHEYWPSPRSTNDLDIFLETELICSLPKMRKLQEVLKNLDYKVIPGVEFMHFKRGNATSEVEINLLTGPIPIEKLKDMSVSPPRVRPRGELSLHAYLTDEAICLEEELEELEIPGSSGSPGFTIFLPQAFSFLIMKLCAFEDRRSNEKKEYGRHHALDIYRILSMLTDEELERTKRLARQNKGTEAAMRAKAIVQEYFSTETSLGVIRVKEHTLFAKDFEIHTMISVLKELFCS